MGSGGLIDRGTSVDVGTVGFTRLRAGEERRHRSRVVSAAIAVCARLIRCEPTQHQRFLFHLFQRLQDSGEFIVASHLRRGPVSHIFPIRHVKERHPIGCCLHAGCGRVRPCRYGPHRFQPRDGNTHTEPAQKGST